MVLMLLDVHEQSEADSDLWNHELQQLRQQYRAAREKRLVNELGKLIYCCFLHCSIVICWVMVDGVGGDIKIEAGLSSGMRHAARVHASAKQRQIERTERLHRGDGFTNQTASPGDPLSPVIIANQSLPVDPTLWSSPLWPSVANRAGMFVVCPILYQQQC
jgi:hypothetical protein